MKKVSKKQKLAICNKEVSIFIARILFGVLFFYSGITKVLDPNFTSAGFLEGAKTFSAMYSWFAAPANIAGVDLLNSWGQLFIGLSLIFGCLTRYASVAGIVLMVLYYFPGLEFPYVDHGFLVDSHIVYLSLFLIFITTNAGQYWGLDRWIFKKT